MQVFKNRGVFSMVFAGVNGSLIVFMPGQGKTVVDG